MMVVRRGGICHHKSYFVPAVSTQIIVEPPEVIGRFTEFPRLKKSLFTLPLFHES